jgi:hypothetical protein
MGNARCRMQASAPPRTIASMTTDLIGENRCLLRSR